MPQLHHVGRSDPRRMTRYTRFAALLLLASALFAGAAAAQDITLRPGAPQDVGMSPALLNAGVALYQEAVDRNDLVGAVVLVARRGRIVLHEAVGWKDKAAGLRMEKNTMFRMASNTKPVIATAVGMLVEQGRLSFDDPVRNHIRSFDNDRSGFILIRHLLSHTSGLRINTLFLQPYMEKSAEHPDAPNLRLEVERFGTVGPVFVPGTSYSYNNPGYNTLGALIEIASGQPLEQFLRGAIYQPLGMVDSYHHEVAGKLDGKLSRMGAVHYEKKDGEWVAAWKPGDPPQVPFVRASGGMISTAMDYAVFLQMWLNGGIYGGKRILKPETMRQMVTPQTKHVDLPGATTHYGFGWSVDANGVYSHGGSDGTFAWVDPANELFGMVFTQTPRGRNPVDKFRELVKLAIMEER